MSTKTIKVITGNKGKAAELSAMLGCELECHKLDLPEIQSLDVAEVAREKAAAAYALVGAPVIVDDTGMSLDAMGGFPGALVAWMLDATGNDGVLKLLAGEDNRAATVTTALGYADENGVQVFVGAVEGTIPTEERGTDGFGYDPIFIPAGHEATFAEMDADTKNSLSMRKRAADKLRAFLEG
ncbi:RdgB/HAM1 family non-canonical purine NTP pyrophosphatase [Sagittula sp. S175]|uniref:RdgB/HAM1 family non-canonical purine NTP pyrophosphatase n=1 Tax=Sagittula sp. S175 TaxID=3415129 RepID=UPI003C7E08A0